MALPPSGRLVRDLAAVVEIPALTVFHARQDLAFGSAIGPEFIGNDGSGHVAQTLQQLAKEALGGIRVTAALHHNIKHVAMLINGSPEVVQFASDAHEHLIQEPFVAGLWPPLLERLGIGSPEAQAPFADRLHASSAGRKELSEENGYVYCSRTKPAIVAEKNGRTMAFYLALFATKESREVIRQNTNFHALYFSICHGMESGRAAAQNLPGVAREFGYRVALSQSQSVALSQIEDILPPGSRRSVEARHDMRPMPSTNTLPSVPQRDWLVDEPIDTFGGYREVPPPRAHPYIVEREEGL